MFPLKKLLVTDLTIDISGLTDKQWAYYQELAERLGNHYKAKGKGRQIFGLSGPAGAGKSVITALLEHLFSSQTDFSYVNIGIDAFHYPNKKLEEAGLRNVKGRFDTYNTALLIDKLNKFKNGEEVNFPSYSRQLHEPVPNNVSIAADNVLMLLEGQWLLSRRPNWTKVRALCSYQLQLNGPAKTLRENVVKRHTIGGRTLYEAEEFYKNSDLLNTNEILNNSVEPDEKILFYKAI